MSRHRAVKNLDLDDELDDGAFDEGDYYDEDMTSEQQAQMSDALRQVLQVLGPASQSGISDKEIRDSLWDSYFDVQGTVEHFLDQVHKREQKKQKLQGNSLEPLDPVPAAPEPEIAHTRHELANLSIADPPRTSASSTSSKLAAKIAANKLAKSASTVPPPPASVPAQSQEVKQKPLSKLQQKMLAAKQPKPSATAPPTAASAPPMSSLPEAGVTQTDAMAVDERETLLPPSFSAPPRDLSATPSPFASSLLPSSLLSSSPSSAMSVSTGGGEGGGRRDLAKHLSRSISPTTNTSLVICTDLWGPSPDDKVMDARKGTALAAGVAVKRK
ncbi:uncharacterized protein JCM15063_006492 [Sporobolomyces koalae]|uniref:uncharacterized protein n=1 Tax=Sporobolomyces koalae TaxID=500713 RepID=UPI003175E893